MGENVKLKDINKDEIWLKEITKITNTKIWYLVHGCVFSFLIIGGILLYTQSTIRKPSSILIIIGWSCIISAIILGILQSLRNFGRKKQKAYKVYLKWGKLSKVIIKTTDEADQEAVANAVSELETKRGKSNEPTRSGNRSND